MDILWLLVPFIVLEWFVAFFSIIAPFVIGGIIAIMFVCCFIKTEFFPSENKELGPLV